MPPKKSQSPTGSAGKARTDRAPGRKPTSPINAMKKMAYPETREEMDTWMEQMRAVTLEYLTYWHHTSHQEPVFSNIRNARQNMDNEWTTTWENLTDIQTGEIYSDTQRTRMLDSMNQHHQNLSRLHKPSEYHIAHAMWEDFLYYQNPWNRRGNKKHRPDMSDSALAQEMMKPSVTMDAAMQWQICLTSLYNVHRIGVREDAKERIHADDVHRYPEAVSGTTDSSKRRREHLLEKFPQPLTPLELDEQSITDRHTQVTTRNATKQNLQDPDAMDIDSDNPPAEPRYYSAATASSWRDDNGDSVPTSWESSSEWGPVIGPVRRRCTTATPHNHPRYKVREVKSLVRTFNWNHMSATDERARKANDGGYLGHYKDMLRYQSHWVLDEADQRVLETNAPVQFTHAFSTPGAERPVVYELSAERSTLQGLGRRERDAEWRKLGDYDSDDDMGGFGGRGGSGGLYGIEFDDDSDSDDGDLFTLSYKECVCACRHDEDCSKVECRGREGQGGGGSGGGRSNSQERGDGGKNDSDGDDDGDEDGTDKKSGTKIRRGKTKDDHAKDGDMTRSTDQVSTSGKASKPTVDQNRSQKDQNANAKASEKNRKPANGNLPPTGNTAATSGTGKLTPRQRSSSRGRTRPRPKPIEDEDQMEFEEQISATAGKSWSVHKPHDKLPEERFRPHPTDPSLNICEYRPKYKNMPGFIQRNEVPAPQKGVKSDKDAGYTFVPTEVKIPMKIGKKRIKGAIWRRDKTADRNAYPSGRYTCDVEIRDRNNVTRETLEWIPQPILRLFRRDTGEYVEPYVSWRGFEKMIENDVLDAKDITDFNKAVTQHYHRRDTDKKAASKQANPWTNDELTRLEQILHRVIHQHGVIATDQNVATRLNGIIQDFNGKRSETDAGFRSYEALRGKLARQDFWKNLKAAAEALSARIDAGEDVSDSELKPRTNSFLKFTLKEESTRKKRGLITQTKGQRESKKRKREESESDGESERGLESESEGSLEEGPEGDDESDDDGDDEDDGGGDDDAGLDEDEKPPRKKAKF